MQTDLTFATFLTNSRAIRDDRPRAHAGFLREIFQRMFPGISLTGWTEHDTALVISYHLLFNDLTKGGKPITDKVRANYKASKVMLTDLGRGTEMLTASTKHIHKIFNNYLKETEMKKSLNETAAATETKAAKTAAPKAADKPKRLTMADALCPLIAEQKMTDMQIAAAASKATGKAIDAVKVNFFRLEFNRGALIKCGAGYAVPKAPWTEVLDKAAAKELAAKEAAKAPVAKAPVAKAAAPVAKAAPVAVKKVAAPAAPVKKVAPVKA